MVSQVDVFNFQAETTQLLDLMVHSLYTNKEIFLRELISNASDALDRLRFEALARPELLSHNSQLEIRLEADSQARTLTLHDNGIGMSREEVIANIGTIAKSGTRELRDKMKQGTSPELLAELIGQFGVGFYSSFMVADSVTLVTRRAGEESATRWESTGDGTYTLAEAEKAHRGTSITLQLKPADPEKGIDDFTDKWVLTRIVKRYSDFVSYPIVFVDQREQAELDEEGKPKKNSPKTIVVEDKVLNSMKPLWTRPRSEVAESDYVEFYKHISHNMDEPLKTISVKAEGLFDYQALLFIPKTAPYDLFYHAPEIGLRLYAKGVLVIEKCQDLLPRYLRFIKGIVDSADLPLNISRQMLQQDRHVAQIRKWLTKKVLDALQEMYAGALDEYLNFWGQFGRALKEGISSDYDNRDRLISLALFQSSRDPVALTSLQDYVGRMKEGQKEIFYLTGPSRSVIENSPHLEALKQKELEVLYLVDTVDELMVQTLTEFEGRKLKSVGKGTVKLGSEQENEQIEKELKEKEEETSELLKSLEKHLERHIKQVRLTNRLTVSPVCLVASEFDYSPQMERLLQLGKGAGPKQRWIMELNPEHQILIKLRERFKQDPHDPLIGDYADLLLGYALLAEGLELPDPVKFNRLVAELMSRVL